jgi:hypothetical protein
MRPKVFVAASCAILAAYLLLRSNLIEIPLGRDEGGYAYAGREILAGGLLYRDVFDLRPPGPFYLYALALAFVPPTPAGIHVFLHVYNFATCLALVSLARALGAGTPAALWTALAYAVASSLPGVQGFQASSELLMLLPLVLAMRLALASGPRRRGALALAGVLAALACWIKQTAFLSLVLLPFWIAFAPRRRRSEAARDLLAFGGGAIAVSLAIVGAFASAGVLRELVYWSFEHPLRYARSDFLLGRATAQLFELLSGSPVLSAAALVGLVVSARREPRQAVFLFALLGLSLLAVLPGKAYEHYFVQLLPPLCLAAGIGLDAVVSRVRAPRMRVAAAAAAGAAVALLPLVIAPGYYLRDTPDEIARAEFGTNPFVESADIASYLREHSRPGDRVLIVGSEPQILFLAQARSATPFIYFYPVLEPFPRHAEFQRRIWDDVRAAPPAWIVQVDLKSSLALAAGADRFLLDRLQELIASDYEPRAVALIESPKGRVIPFEEDLLTFARGAIERAPGRIFLYRRR